ncbi:hypothetical protein D0469_16365 [Peribacillus saganii]|uniref:Uncharacterized protein n=1 Tax=Peribacillus saganii TaxID=2303992 RepID=A0A372LKA9_9BACI|nr:hypothetical protein [Peribacillus saganii]RFU67015.1 hypothetical protein D0469_16365 [Peribacillus saganii]
MILEGHIISGDFDQTSNEFSLQKVKNLSTQSVLNQAQINNIYQYLKKNQDDNGGQVLTLYDQMPVHLSQDEINQLILDLEQVQSMYE